MSKWLSGSMLILIVLCVLSGCDDKKQVKTGDLSVDSCEPEYSKEAGDDRFMLEWYVNMLETDTGSTEPEPIMSVDYTGGDVKTDIDIDYARNDKEKEEIEVLCMMLVDGIPVPFSVDGGDKKVTNPVDIINGTGKKITVEFYPFGIDEQYKDLIFIGVPFYSADETKSMDDNTVLYCKKQIRSLAGKTDALEKSASTDFTVTDSTMEMYGKELYDISKYNGGLRDYILKDINGNWYYMGDYKESEGYTYILDNGEIADVFSGASYLRWKSDDGRFVNAGINIGDPEGETHHIFAITVRSDEVVLARKSFNVYLDKEE